jgi:hypothetical protein
VRAIRDDARREAARRELTAEARTRLVGGDCGLRPESLTAVERVRRSASPSRPNADQRRALGSGVPMIWVVTVTKWPSPPIGRRPVPG